MAALAYMVLQASLIRAQGNKGLLARAVGTDGKGKGSIWLYLVGIAVDLAGWPGLAFALLWVPALLWAVPDSRIERLLRGRE